VVSAGEEGSGVSRGELTAFLSGDAVLESGRRMFPDCGLCCHERVPDRLIVAASAFGVLGFRGSWSCRTCAGEGEPVKRWRDSSRASRCVGGSIVGVDVSRALSCTALGVPDAEGVGVAFSGLRLRARSGEQMS